MNLSTYFHQHKGTGVMATADKDGVVNTALYARPHVFEDGSLGFITRERLTRHNLRENPQASYLFKVNESGGGGIRLRLRMDAEFTNHPLLDAPSRNPGGTGDTGDGDKRYLITFRVEKCLQLVGGEEIKVE